MSAKKMTTPLVKALTLLLLIVSVLSSISMRASAAPPAPPAPPTLAQVMYASKVNTRVFTTKGQSFFYTLDIKATDKDSFKIQSVKSSSSSVKASCSKTEITLKPQKTGKATITVTYTLNGKKHTARYKTAFFNRKDVFRKVTVGGKSQPTNYPAVTVSGKKTKVSVKLGSGWKVKSFKVTHYSAKKDTYKTVKGTFKNGSYVPVYSDGETSVAVTVVHTKTGTEATNIITIKKK